MAYDATPNEGDVILNAWQERDRVNVALYLREGEDGQGAEILDLWDEAATQLFEDGFLKCGRLTSGDATLRETAFAYAREHGLGALGGFKARLEKLVADTVPGLLAAYEALDAAEPAGEDEEPEDRRERLLGLTIERAMGKGAFDWLSDDRREGVEEHLREELEDLVPAAAAPAP